MQEQIQPIALLGQYEDNNNLYPAAKILNEEQNVAFDPVFIAGCLVSLYEAFLSHVPESKQLDFEKNFKSTFVSMFENKEQYTIRIHDYNNQ